MDAMSCLAPPPALTFADAAIARALYLSTMSSSSDSASSSSSLSAPAPHHHYAAPPLAADSPPGRRGHHPNKLAPAAGRAGKRRSRASKRAPTTYISTDPTNFRIMVQHITGVQAHDDIMQPTMLLADAYAAPTGPPASAPLHHHQPCFPTLDSWNVMYETTTTDLL